MKRRLLLAILGAFILGFVGQLPPHAEADLADEQALAERHAPVIRLVEQVEPCGPGEPYDPIDVDVLFDESTVALRGPWNSLDLVRIAPADTDLENRFEYHLDFPGNALQAGCTYERWAQRLTGDTEPTVYAHVTTDPNDPDKLALQYWFFYVFNDFNNTHEGDWEMIQLVFDVGTAREALEVDPTEIGYSSHEGAERAAWGDAKLELVDGTHPVVYPAAGSHANKYTEALYLGASAQAGVGCDDTRGPHRELNPVVLTIPSDEQAAVAAFPWITFEGRWGELQPAFFNGPTGPNLKGQWTEPIAWSEGWRGVSYAVPTGGLLGTGATDLFCSAVERGSRGLITFLRNPAPTLLLTVGLVGLLVFLVVRATWTPVAPLRVARRRSWGQMLSASARAYVEHPFLFVGLGLLAIPAALATIFVQWLLAQGLNLGGATGDVAGLFAYLSLVIGTALALLGFGLLQAATATALVELDAGRPAGPLTAYRHTLRHLRPLLGAIAVFVAVWLALTSTGVLIPVAIWLAVRWSLLAPAIRMEDASAVGALRRSAELVRGRWLRVGSLVGLGAAIAFAAGPVIGVLLIFVSAAPLGLLNLIAGLVYVFALPFVALVTTYVYFDARTRVELEPYARTRELPAEITI